MIIVIFEANFSEEHVVFCCVDACMSAMQFATNLFQRVRYKVNTSCDFSRIPDRGSNILPRGISRGADLPVDVLGPFPDRVIVLFNMEHTVYALSEPQPESV